jgi:hypothetical protein
MMRADAWHVLFIAAVTDYERTLSRLAVSDDRLVASTLAQSDPLSPACAATSRCAPCFALLR